MADDSLPQKRCPKCSEIKPLEMYGKHKGKKDGLTSWCKQCLSRHKTEVPSVQPAEKTCKKCGEIKPIDQFYRYKYVHDGTQAQCKKCQREKQEIYKEANREVVLERHRAWRANNRERHREYSRNWQRNNPERARERQRAWRINNIEHKREYNRNWQRAHPDVIRAKTQRRLTRKKNNGGTFTHKELTAMRLEQAGVCAYCKRQYDPDALSMDHIIPLNQGGRHEAPNICLACGTCNSSKGGRTPD